MSDWTPERLVAFSDRVAQAFRDKQIGAPVHLCGGNEASLLRIFKSIKPDDWVFSTWRSTYHALLHGLPEEYVFAEILAGRSMYLSSAKYKFMAGSIVAGMCPIACGVALAIKRNKSAGRVHVFVGDMTARTGLFYETFQYAQCNELPMRFVIEDNGMSTDTPTDAAWGYGAAWLERGVLRATEYTYKRTRPHVGVGEHVQF